jgi:hypothetical protein
MQGDGRRTSNPKSKGRSEEMSRLVQARMIKKYRLEKVTYFRKFFKIGCNFLVSWVENYRDMERWSPFAQGSCDGSYNTPLLQDSRALICQLQHKNNLNEGLNEIG